MNINISQLLMMILITLSKHVVHYEINLISYKPNNANCLSTQMMIRILSLNGRLKNIPPYLDITMNQLYIALLPNVFGLAEMVEDSVKRVVVCNVTRNVSFLMDQ